MYKVKRFFLKIVKILIFIPILWSDEDWDFYYFLQMIQAKLKSMENYFSRSGIVVKEQEQEILSGIRKTRKSIDAFLNCEQGNYEVKPPFEVTHKSVPSPDEQGFTQLITMRGDTGKELTSKEEKVYLDYLRSTLKEEEDCWNAIWDTIKEEGRKWWD